MTISRTVSDEQEAMAYIARSRTFAVGSAPSGTEPSSINNSVDLKTDYDFGRARADHSGQFLRDIQLMYARADGGKYDIPFYWQLLQDLGVAPTIKPQ